ncbi:hypothetical protein NE237_014238 [Protea cynaroides]|uniref:Uncharacterized protein n=1 Tax=Protea cynaroides TaxID=273540 RepID=A0A9Q0JQQ6_9MAGN|nr:hypothetical protein NE237_014238 [Protea cynaroides]
MPKSANTWATSYFSSAVESEHTTHSHSLSMLNTRKLRSFGTRRCWKIYTLFPIGVEPMRFKLGFFCNRRIWRSWKK